MGQRLVPHSGYRQKQAKLFNYVKTQGKNMIWVILILHGVRDAEISGY